MRTMNWLASRTHGLAGTGIGWGLADQSLSSVTNVALTVLAGRRLGPADLGVVSIGFSSYVIALVLLRALVTEPAVVFSSARSDDRVRALMASTTITISAGGLIALSLGLLGWMLGGAIGHGLLLVSPWILPALLQDFWRFSLFSSGRRAAAVFNDALWLAIMAVMLPFAWQSSEPWAIVGSWGLGATGASLLGFLQMRTIPGNVWASMRWWRREGAPLGGWLAVESAFLALGSQGAVFLLALFVAPADLGGLRAVQSIFAPLTLIGPAITLPGLPALTWALRYSPRDARAMAMRFSLAATALAGVYMAAFLVARGRLLGLVFGNGFTKFSDLVMPVAMAQMAHAGAVGYILLFKASSRGRVLAIARASGTMVALTLAGFFAWRNGVVGSAWGLACGVGVSTGLILLRGRRILTQAPLTDSSVSNKVFLVPPGTGNASHGGGDREEL
jgi:O-antigen/teichoic acid export membrane protein